jgi:serine/threonine protein kinase
MHYNNFNYIIVHGDLKPNNVLLDSKNKISITDFCMIKFIDKKRNKMIESSGYTQLYSSPESVLH